MSATGIIGSAVAGLGATLVMESAASRLYEREDERARSREEPLRSAMATTLHVREAARAVGREVADEPAERLGTAIHYALGAAGGPSARLLAARGITPLKAGLTVAAGTSVFGDEDPTRCSGLRRRRPTLPGRRVPSAPPPAP